MAGGPHTVVIEAIATTNCPSARMRMSDHITSDTFSDTHTHDHTDCGFEVSGSNVLLPSATRLLEMNLNSN